MHTAVLKKEVLEVLDPKPGENFIDGTINGGGHALAILEKTAPEGKLLGIDWSQEIIENLKPNKNLIPVCDNFANLRKIVKEKNFSNINGILLDLGMSSWHLEESKKGFSFLRNEPLDMRYNPNSELTALAIVNTRSQEEIEKILEEYGQERFARKISRQIVKARKIKPLETTAQLAEIIKNSTPVWYQRRKTNPNTKTFQALRIAVNDELNNLKKVLPQATEMLEKRGKIAVISFHSLEDGIVKNFFRENSKKGILEIITKKPILPSHQEIKINPRSRSAKLRTAMKL